MASEEAIVDLQIVAIDKPDDMNVIVGQSHFIKTVEDVHEALAGVSPISGSVSRSAKPRGLASFAVPETTTVSSSWPPATLLPSAQDTRSSCSWRTATR